MKIIFLDIDGVLNTSETFIKKQLEKSDKIEIDDFRVEYLKEIVQQTGAKIVLSSSWRLFYNKIDNEIIPTCKKAIELEKILKNYQLYIYDITPYDEKRIRQNEIKQWLNTKDIESFIIIDDESYNLQNYQDQLIKTNFRKQKETIKNMDDCIGLCECHIQQAIKMLNEPNKIKIK